MSSSTFWHKSSCSMPTVHRVSRSYLRRVSFRNKWTAMLPTNNKGLIHVLLRWLFYFQNNGNWIATNPSNSSNFYIWLIDWLIEQGLTSAPTQYRLYGRRFLQVWWPNQQCQSTGGWSVIQTGLSLTKLTSPCYNTTTCMQILYKKII